MAETYNEPWADANRNNEPSAWEDNDRDQVSADRTGSPDTDNPYTLKDNEIKGLYADEEDLTQI